MVVYNSAGWMWQHCGPGLTMAARYADSDWTLSFLFPAIFVTAVGAVVFLLLVPQPSGKVLGY